MRGACADIGRSSTTVWASRRAVRFVHREFCLSPSIARHVRAAERDVLLFLSGKYWVDEFR
jgi:hypothetical protein